MRRTSSVSSDGPSGCAAVDRRRAAVKRRKPRDSRHGAFVRL